MSWQRFSLYLICTSALPQKPNKWHDYILISGDSVWHTGSWFKGYCGGERVHVCQHLTHFHRFPSLITGTMMHVGRRPVTFDRAGDPAKLHSFHLRSTHNMLKHSRQKCNELSQDIAYINPNSVLSLLQRSVYIESHIHIISFPWTCACELNCDFEFDWLFLQYFLVLFESDPVFIFFIVLH